MINNIRYAGDVVLIASSREHLQKLLNTVVTESENIGLTLNTKKTETMLITKSGLPLAFEIKISQSSLKHVDKFKYLGTIITGDGRCEQEIRSRTEQAFNKLKDVLINKHPSFHIRERVLQYYFYLWV